MVLFKEGIRDPLGVLMLPDMIKQTGKIFTISEVFSKGFVCELEEVPFTWTNFMLTTVNSIKHIYD